MVVLGCLGLLQKKAKLGNDSVKKTTNDQDEHAIIGYNFLGFYCFGKNQLSMIDVKSTRVRKVSGLGALRGDRIRMCNSCNGLILLISFSPVSSIPYSARFCVIFNPKTNQIVKRITPPVWFPCIIPVGFFYHPLAKEYRTLNMVSVGGVRYEYHIYLFGSNTWRAAKNHNNHTATLALLPTCTKQVLCWCCKTEDKILVFDIISEEFRKKHFPVHGKDRDKYTPPTLVAKNNEDSLCCCYVHRAELSIDVWVLEDYANWSWNRKYVVNVNWCKTDRYPSEAWRAYATGVMWRVNVVCIQKDELVFCYKDDDMRSIYSYHLVSGFSVRTKLSKTDWKKYTKHREVDGQKEQWYSMFRGFIKKYTKDREVDSQKEQRYFSMFRGFIGL